MTERPILRRAVPADADACAGVIYRAFCGVADRYGFPHDFSSEDAVRHFSGMLTGHPGVYGTVAEDAGRVVGCCFLDERDAVKSVRPIVVEPGYQSRGIGRRLMQPVIDRGADAPSVRLVQDAFNVVSFSLYTSLGFDAKEPLALLMGKVAGQLPPQVIGRPLQESDLHGCADLCRRAHGFERTNQLRDSLKMFSPHVLLREGRVVAYASAPAFWPLNHGVAETADDLKHLLISAAGHANPLAMLLPIRQSETLRWGISAGLRVVKLMTLMSMRKYNEPSISWFPSVGY